MKKYICKVGSPFIPKGSEAQWDDKPGANVYRIYFRNKNIISLYKEAIEENDCWEQVQEENVLPTSGTRWDPKDGENYYTIHNDGEILYSEWTGDDIDIGRISVGNVFQTRELAEAELMRMKSRSKRWDFVPKEEKGYWCYDIDDNKCRYNNWRNMYQDFAHWNIGNCHCTGEDAERWGREYSKYFLPPQDE